MLYLSKESGIEIIAMSAHGVNCELPRARVSYHVDDKNSTADSALQ
jgi:hypothetical protein